MNDLLTNFADHPAIISALAALASLFFAAITVTLYFRTWSLMQRKARPWLFVEDISNHSMWGLKLKIKNSGEHPARLLRIKCRIAPLNKPEENLEAEDKKLSINMPVSRGSVEKDMSFSDELAVGGYVFVNYKALDYSDHILFFKMQYEDVFTKKTFVKPIWQKYKYLQGEMGHFEALSTDEQKRVQPLFDRPPKGSKR